MQLSLSKGSTPLHFAAGLQIVPLCQWLIDSGCYVNQLGSAGTPLHWALLEQSLPHCCLHNGDGIRENSGSLELLKLLVDAGADARCALTCDDSTTSTLSLISKAFFEADDLPVAIQYLFKANAKVDDHFIQTMLEENRGPYSWWRVHAVMRCV